VLSLDFDIAVYRFILVDGFMVGMDGLVSVCGDILFLLHVLLANESVLFIGAFEASHFLVDGHFLLFYQFQDLI
jgi:hypothetical protein